MAIDVGKQTVLVFAFSGAAARLGRSLAAEDGFMTDRSDRTDHFA